ncbi:related to cytochrome P450 CYP2 subfamily [Phialocephala subalpina]|uniref:Related to cytochrome P450 CYP2 subfamily n=1 Tax=Phialocephala subalpina TaxID=576137 RepID=A0A1L7X5N1_9HELO|nr:related to cytochrome P450 CYP2 subfamily [Phialocephala subalpina]
MAETFWNQATRLFTFPNLYALIIICAFLKFLRQVIHYRFVHPLKEFPGPLWWGVTRVPLAWSNFWGREIQRETELAREYEYLPTMLLVSSAKTLPLIYHRTAKKTPHYTLFSFGPEKTVFHMWEHSEYAERAKIVAGIYSSKAHMPSTEETMDQHLMEWIEKLKTSYANPGKMFDVGEWVQYYTVDTTLELAFGDQFQLGYVKNGKDVLGISHGFKSALPLYGIVCRLHPFFTWLNTTVVGTFFEWYILHGDFQIGNMTRYVDKCLKARLAEMKEGNTEKRNDMLQSFIDARTPQGTPLSFETLRGEVQIVVMAGADNTTAAICTTLYHILQSPIAHSKVMEELIAAEQAGIFGKRPRYADILRYCRFYVACVRESLRLNLSLPSIIPRYSTSDVDHPLVIDGRTIPPNTEVASNPWITQRDPELYGEDAEEWKPERWLNAENAALFEKHNFTFGYGSRLCLRRQLGIMSVMKTPLMASIYRTVDITFADINSSCKTFTQVWTSKEGNQG